MLQQIDSTGTERMWSENRYDQKKKKKALTTVVKGKRGKNKTTKNNRST
jgi:hypothetical protein